MSNKFETLEEFESQPNENAQSATPELALEKAPKQEGSMSLLSWLLNFFISFGLLALGVVLGFLMSRASVHFRQAFPQYDAMNESVEENVTAMRAVKAFNRETMQTKVFKGTSKRIYSIFIKAELILSAVDPVIEATIWTCMLLISWIGAHLIVQDQLTTGDLASLLMYCMNILMSLVMLSMTIVMITMSTASAKRIVEVLTEKDDMTAAADPVKQVKDGSIEFENVSFKYSEN